MCGQTSVGYRQMGGFMSGLRLFVRAMLCVSTLMWVVTVRSSGAQGLASADLSRLRAVGSVAVSPDGHRLAYQIVMRDRPGRPYGQLWIMDLATQKSERVGGEKDSAGSPLWAPDGKVLAFAGNQGGKTGLFVAHQDGSEIISLAPTTGTNSPLPGTGREITWSPDGKQIGRASCRERV